MTTFIVLTLNENSNSSNTAAKIVKPSSARHLVVERIIILARGACGRVVASEPF